SALQAWVDQMTLRGFSMSPPMQLGDAFMLGLCLGTELSGGTCVHMPIDLLQEAAAILLADRESAYTPMLSKRRRSAISFLIGSLVCVSSAWLQKDHDAKLMNFEANLFAPISEQVGDGLHATALEPHFLR